MKKLTGYQAKYLRSLAHSLKPVVFVGQKGITDTLIASTELAFERHELIKVKFVDFKEKNQKKEIAEIMKIKTGSLMAGMIGHVAIFYKQHRDPEKRRIKLPERSDSIHKPPRFSGKRI
jgi:RNA-binding protein